MKTIDFSYFIERYNAVEMSEVEKQWFQKELEGNKKLRDEVEFRKKTDLALRNHDIIQLRSKLAEIEKRRATEVPAKSPGKHINMKYAAAIAGLVLLGSIAVFTGSRNLTNDEIFDRYYKSYETTTGTRSEQLQLSDELNIDYSYAIDCYNVHDYKNAAIYFTKVLKITPDDMNTTLLYGVSNFEMKNFPVAKQSFRTVVKDNNNYFIEDAQWYLALCYLKTDEQDQAIEQLNNIKNLKNIYSKDARKILRNLK
ncbi:MAG: tetratricopeptide repeat protein [Bacteroidales bacterium]|nr:tetratricopeptide repeat protein [Bacteroidales bacterium]